MRPLPINLLPESSVQPGPMQRRLRWLWPVLAALGVAAFGHQALRVIELRAQLRDLADQAYARSAAAAPPAGQAAPGAAPTAGQLAPGAAPTAGQFPPGSVPTAAAPPYLDDARAIAALAAFDVAGALKALESLREPGLRVASAVIDAKERRARIDIEVSDLAQIARALETLNQGEPQPLWRLLQAQAGAAGQPARATLEMRR